MSVERRGLMFVLSSPSGAGKTTLSRLLIERMPGLRMSVSATTRPMRPGEVDGRDYSFVDQSRFKEMVQRNELLEWATVFDNSYGTPRAPVESALSAGRDVMFDIDWQGTQQLREKARADVVSVFILPPSMDELLRRLRGRASETEEVVLRRYEVSRREIEHYGFFDYLIVNDVLDVAFDDLRAVIMSERCKRWRRAELAETLLRHGRVAER